MNKLHFFIVLWIFNNILKGTRFFGVKRKLLNSIGVKIGEDTKIVGPINIGRALNVEIGSNNWIGTNLTIHGNGKVVIGNNNDFAPDITILTGTHEIDNSERRAGKGVNLEYAIGSGNWIGAKATLVNGCTIGNGVVIGACSLVTKSCEDNSLYLGLPAKKVKELGT